MDVTGTYIFSATPEQVWQAICDPAALKACIPQCEEMVRLDETHWQGFAKVKVGPFKLRFQGDITLSDLNPPHSYVMSLLAKSRIGSAHGQSAVSLQALAVAVGEPPQTQLYYTASTHIGIKVLDNAIRYPGSCGACASGLGA
jgi:carbon monoxide dehydrogenase subunit G